MSTINKQISGCTVKGVFTRCEVCKKMNEFEHDGLIFFCYFAYLKYVENNPKQLFKDISIKDISI